MSNWEVLHFEVHCHDRQSRLGTPLHARNLTQKEQKRQWNIAIINMVNFLRIRKTERTQLFAVKNLVSKTKSHISRTSQNVFDVKTHSRWDVFEMGDKIFSLKSIILECHEDREW